MVSSESGSMQICTEKSRTCTTFSTRIFERHKVPLTTCAGENSELFLTHENFEKKNVERELEDSLSEYEIAAGRNSRDRRSYAVRDVICDDTHPDFNFGGPEWRQKTAFMFGGSCLRYGGPQAAATRPYV